MPGYFTLVMIGRVAGPSGVKERAIVDFTEYNLIVMLEVIALSVAFSSVPAASMWHIPVISTFCQRWQSQLEFCT